MVREGRRRDAVARSKRSKKLVVLRRDSRTGNRLVTVSRLGTPSFAAAGANHSATNADRQKAVLGSVSAPDLVFPSMASWLSDRSGGANPRGRAESRWSEDLGLALLELLWPSQSI